MQINNFNFRNINLPNNACSYDNEVQDFIDNMDMMSFDSEEEFQAYCGDYYVDLYIEKSYEDDECISYNVSNSQADGASAAVTVKKTQKEEPAEEENDQEDNDVIGWQDIDYLSIYNYSRINPNVNPLAAQNPGAVEAAEEQRLADLQAVYDSLEGAEFNSYEDLMNAIPQEYQADTVIEETWTNGYYTSYNVYNSQDDVIPAAVTVFDAARKAEDDRLAEETQQAKARTNSTAAMNTDAVEYDASGIGSYLGYNEDFKSRMKQLYQELTEGQAETSFTLAYVTTAGETAKALLNGQRKITISTDQIESKFEEIFRENYSKTKESPNAKESPKARESLNVDEAPKTEEVIQTTNAVKNILNTIKSGTYQAINGLLEFADKGVNVSVSKEGETYEVSVTYSDGDINETVSLPVNDEVSAFLVDKGLISEEDTGTQGAARSRTRSISYPNNDPNEGIAIEVQLDNNTKGTIDITRNSDGTYHCTYTGFDPGECTIDKYWYQQILQEVNKHLKSDGTLDDTFTYDEHNLSGFDNIYDILEYRSTPIPQTQIPAPSTVDETAGDTTPPNPSVEKTTTKDEDGNTTTVTKEDGKITSEITLDKQGNVKEEKTYSYENGTTTVVETYYHENGVQEFIKKNGKIVEYTAKWSDGSVEIGSYDAEGNCRSTVLTSPNGTQVEKEYDTAGNVIREITIQKTYDENGNVIGETLVSDNTYVYNQDGTRSTVPTNHDEDDDGETVTDGNNVTPPPAPGTGYEDEDDIYGVDGINAGLGELVSRDENGNQVWKKETENGHIITQIDIHGKKIVDEYEDGEKVRHTEEDLNGNKITLEYGYDEKSEKYVVQQRIEEYADGTKYTYKIENGQESLVSIDHPQDDTPEWQKNNFESEEDYEDAKRRGLDHSADEYYTIKEAGNLDNSGDPRDPGDAPNDGSDVNYQPVLDATGKEIGTIFYNEDGTVDKVVIHLDDGRTMTEYSDGRQEFVETTATGITMKYHYEDGKVVVDEAQDTNGNDVKADTQEQFDKKAAANKILDDIKGGSYGTGANFDRNRFINDMVNYGGYEIVVLDKLTNQQIYDILINNKNSSFDEILKKLQAANYNAGGTGHSGGSGGYGQPGGTSFGLGDQGFNDVFGNTGYSSGYHMDFWGNWVPNTGFGGGSAVATGGGGAHY